jgi:hypothetical protein
MTGGGPPGTPAGGIVVEGGVPAGVVSPGDVPEGGGITDAPPLIVPALQPSKAPDARVAETTNPRDFGDMPMWWEVSPCFVFASAAFGPGAMHTGGAFSRRERP